MSTFHSLVSPSAAHRWSTCPASVPFTKDIPDTESEVAAEGTLAHAIAAQLLQGVPLDVSAIRKTCEEHSWNADDMLQHTQAYADYIQSLDTPNGSIRIEQTLNMDWLAPGCFGTADAILASVPSLHIVDLKYGYNPVYAQDNPQLIIYGWSAIQNLPDITDVTLTIFQPRCNSISSWKLTRNELYEKSLRLSLLAKRALIEDRLPPSDWTFHPTESACRYCKGAGTCKALQNSALAISRHEVPSLTNEELSQAYGGLPVAQEWAKALESTVLSKLQSGEEIPGYRLAPGREGPRKWSDEVKAAEILSRAVPELAYKKQEPITPTQASALLKTSDELKSVWDELNALITRNPGKLTIKKAD